MQIKKASLFNLVDVLSYVLVGISIVAVPLLLDKHLANIYILPKQYVLFGLIMLNLLAATIKIAITKKVVYRQSFLDLPVLLFLGAGLLSTVFSANLYDSFFGRNEYFVLNFVFLLFLALYYFILVNSINSIKIWRRFLDLLVIVGGLSTIPFVVQGIFKFDLLKWWTGGGQALNVLTGANSVYGLFLIIIFVLSAGQLMRKNLPTVRLALNIAASLLSFVVLVLLGFSSLWWLLLLSLVALLFLGVGFVNEARTPALTALFALFIITTIFIVFGSPKSWQATVPAEVSLGLKPTAQITYQVLKSGVFDFIFGKGLGAFGAAFSQFRPVDFNADNLAWSLRFHQPIGSFWALLSEGGLLMFLAFVFLLLSYLGHTVHFWLKNRNKGSNKTDENIFAGDEENLKLEIFLVAVAWLILTISSVAIFFDTAIWWLWWLLLGLGVAGLSLINKQVIKTKEWGVIDMPQYNLSFSFGMILVITFILLSGVWGVRLYWAENAYASALRSPNYQEAEQNLNTALSLRDNYDLYHAALAQAYLSQAADLSKNNSADNMAAVSNLLARAVNEAQKASQISPASVAIWENSATMYENAVLLVPEARDWAVKSLEKATALEPTNPVLAWRLGNDYFLANKNEEALKAYQKAIDLKPDYAPPYIGLAGIYENSQKIDKAVEVYNQALALRLNNPEILFNYGRLLYNRNQNDDRKNTEQLWLATAQLQPNYSNVLYSLGLLYEGQGNTAKALDYYKQVKNLNPGNQEIINKINNLGAN